MFRRLILPILVLILTLIGGVYVLAKIMKSPSISSSDKNSTTTQLSELEGTWGTYTSPEWEFAINHPLDVKTELTQNGVHFLKLGPTQSTATELFDGLSLLVYTSKLTNITFNTFVQNEYTKVKNEPITESISELKETNISTFTGYSFISTGLGKSTTYFLRNGSDGYIKITDMTVEPPNEKRNFHKTVSQMLASLQITTSPPPTSEPGKEGKAETAIKEFAAHDLNVSLSDITITSMTENEWTDGCFGLAQEGEMCTQVITPGYEVTVQANGKQRIYRTNADGSLIKIKK